MQISKFSITNYRSLVDFKVEKFDSTTIFFGLNNAGKSNILNAIHIIFQRKPQYEAPTGFLPAKNFYEGYIRDFSHSFFNHNDSLSIDFSVEVAVNTSELIISSDIKPLLTEWPDALTITVDGSIVKNKEGYEKGLAEIKTKSIKLNGVVIYDPANSDGYYFPTLLAKGKANLGALSEAFSSFINPLNDCVYIIPNNRDMYPIAFNQEGEPGEISPKTFKQFLYKLYLSERDHSVFEEIDDTFATAPFVFGRISFSESNQELEIMIKENKMRLPIKHLGSGILQILYIISGVIYNKSKIVCVEELEQNLSPKLQNQALRKLQSMLGKYLDQIIISSHSSVFANAKLSKAIHYIDKDGMKTIWSEEITDTLGDKAKSHFIPTVLQTTTYTNDAYTAYNQEL